SSKPSTVVSRLGGCMMPALLIRMSIGRPSALSSPPSALTLASYDRSRLLIVSFAFGTVARICSIADSPLAWLRMADHVGAGRRQPGGQPQAEAGVRAGDDGQLAGQVGNGDCELVACHGHLLVSV